MKTYLVISVLALFAFTALNAQDNKELDLQKLSAEAVLKEDPKTSKQIQGVPPQKTWASFKKGNRALVHFIQSKLVYPTEARRYGVEGAVTVQFTVMPNGALRNVEIVESLGHGCDELVRSMVKEMPAWNPATEAGRAIPSKVRIPVHFSLK